MNRLTLKDKRILFFSVRTFNLENEIILKLKEKGAIVDFYDERPSNTTLSKGLIRLKSSLLQRKINKYYTDILREISDKTYDYLFLNKGEVMPSFFIESLRKKQPNCIFIFHTWDSFENNRHATSILEYFDRKYTFDPKDAKEYGISFRPLFFLDAYSEIKNKIGDIKNDLLFVGTAHSDRYKVVKKVEKECANYNLTVFSYFFMQGRLVYLFKRLFDKTFKSFDYKDLSFKSLTNREIVDMYAESKVILDINHPKQVGLTLRTFEALGAERKLITTNKDIINYPFYNAVNVCVIDRNNIDIPKSFFNEEYQKIDKNIYHNHSLDGWIDDMFL